MLILVIFFGLIDKNYAITFSSEIIMGASQQSLKLNPFKI